MRSATPACSNGRADARLEHYGSYHARFGKCIDRRPRGGPDHSRPAGRNSSTNLSAAWALTLITGVAAQGTWLASARLIQIIPRHTPSHLGQRHLNRSPTSARSERRSRAHAVRIVVLRL